MNVKTNRAALFASAVFFLMTGCPGNNGDPALQGTVEITLPTFFWVGSTLAANVSGLSPNAIPAFQWERRIGASGTFNAIPGATAETYTLTLADDNRQIRVVVSSPGFSTSIPSEPTATVRRLPVADQLEALREMETLPAEITITTGMPEEWLDTQMLAFDEGDEREIEITLTGTPGDVLRLNNPGFMFALGRNVTLTLKDVELRGIANNTSALVGVGAYSTLVMMDGARITGNVNTNNNMQDDMSFGGGVLVSGRASFVMRGGAIDHNEARVGGGLVNGGDFTMYDGMISDNVARVQGGGVRLIGTGNANMFGGTVSRNTTPDLAAGVLADQSATFTMHGGDISDNTAGRVGGGVTAFGTFVMESGNISGNTAAEDGGGVAVAPGGGIFIMRGGVIADNTAAEWDGGGVANGNIFTMYDGVVSGNNAGNEGGGVFVAWHSTFDMRGGRISGNRAAWGGGIANGAGTLRISDGIIHGSNAESGDRNTAFAWAAVGNRRRYDEPDIPYLAEHGRFNGNDFERVGDLNSTGDTIEVVNGVLISPLSLGVDTGGAWRPAIRMSPALSELSLSRTIFDR